MISVISQFNNETALGLIARAALSLESDGNPAANIKFPFEYELRNKMIEEIRKCIGFSIDDDSPAAIEKIGDALDREIIALIGEVDMERVKLELATRGEIPSDLYHIKVIDNVREIYGSRYYPELTRITETVKNFDFEQHLAPADEGDEPALISLFAKHFPDGAAYKSFTLLVAGQRNGLDLVIHQAWRLYDDTISTRGVSDLVEMLRRFSNEFGLEFKINNLKTKFLINSAQSGLSASNFRIEILPLLVRAGNGKMKEKPVKFTLSRFTNHRKDGSPISNLTMVINLDKYQKSLVAHGWQ